ncbi:hypothetical protein OF829_05145 [Sphingomonas sp. LB-2]|uniref:hypothetical protein n=1 Tax=Sphingomonas caeni TaxID=2984949 RepID=UPI00222E6FA4|nr:hypothetical protein [Sphingomonas caeni]MCW3846615.1 hypothetical protein [Sphingomonas caeni]
MDLIDRYLHAVRRNLPQGAKGNGADDIVAELRDDLMSRKEDREERLGRDLTKDETSALLKEFGHPLVVASRFRRHQYLIGPEVFPFYLSVMRVVLMIVVAVVIAVSVGKALTGGGNPFLTWVESMSGIFDTVLLNAAIITIIFVVMERIGFPAEHLVTWVPDNLPDVIDKQQGPWEAAIEVGLGIAFILWWTGTIHIPWRTGGPDFHIEPSPVFMELYWPILILASARLVHNLIQWLRPRWKALLALTNAATGLGGLAILFLVYQSGHWVTVVATGMPLDEAAKLQESLDLALRIAFVVVAIVWTFGTVSGLWRMARRRIPA